MVQGKRDGGKLAAAREICNQLGITLNEVAYIGDDINCYELLKAVGVAACPADANTIIKNITSIQIMSRNGGEGCVREFVDKYLKQLQNNFT
jgi:3-deoxy-D-manno-octulosonate 8-phosphate phosphatase KdsC-like HAD superfamily phosphatase